MNILDKFNEIDNMIKTEEFIKENNNKLLNAKEGDIIYIKYHSNWDKFNKGFNKYTIKKITPKKSIRLDNDVLYKKEEYIVDLNGLNRQVSLICPIKEIEEYNKIKEEIFNKARFIENYFEDNILNKDVEIINKIYDVIK